MPGIRIRRKATVSLQRLRHAAWGCTVLLFLFLPVVAKAQFYCQTNSYVTEIYTNHEYIEVTNITITILGGSSGSPNSLTIPSTINGYPVTAIANQAFIGFNLTNVTFTFPSSITSIGAGAFYNQPLRQSIVLPAANIGNAAFEDGPKFTSVTISNNAGNYFTTIGESAFIFGGLTNLVLGNSVTNIGQGALGDNPLLAIMVDPQNPTYSSLNGVLFNKNQTTLVQYPSALVENYAVPNTVTNIIELAFQQAQLTSVTIPGSVPSIGPETFQECYGLTNLIISNGVANIGAYAFEDCGLMDISIPASVTNIGSPAFYDCPNLIAMTVDPQNPAYSSLNGALFDEGQTTLLQYPSGVGGSYTIPATVASVGDYAFAFCDFTSVIFSPGVTNVGTGAFSYCPNLSSVYFEGNAPNFSGIGPYYNYLTFYYLPGTTGWAAFADAYSSIPVVPWLPQIQTGNGFGLQNNQFSFNANWASGQTVVVEACTNLANPVWVPVATNIFVSGSIQFSDPQWTNYPSRYYQIIPQ